MTSTQLRVVAVGLDKHDRGILQQAAARVGYKLTAVSTISAAMCMLAGNQAPVILCEDRLPDGNWRDLLNLSPKVIVVSRIADESVWTAVLNRGGCDVLASPLEEHAVLHALGSVCRDDHHLADDPGERATAAVR